MSARAESNKRRPWLLALLAIALLFVAWRDFTLGLANVFVRADRPAAALAWRPEHPEALLQRAESRQRGGKGREAAALAQSGIAAAPLDGRGYRVLALEADKAGHADQAREMHVIAAERGPRDLGSHAWLAEQALKAGDFDQVFFHFDRMLRVQPEVLAATNKVMIPLAMERRAQAPLVRVLAENPPWRLGYTLSVIREASDPNALFRLMEQLRASKSGLGREELAAWLDRLAADHDWARAYLVWVQSLGPEQSREIGNVYNGRFEFEPGNSGFDWRFTDVGGARIFRSAVEGAKGKALGIAFEDQRVPFQHVRQLLALPAGKYRFSGRVRLDDLRTERGLVWTLACAEDYRALAESEPFHGRSDWRTFSVDFDVPAPGCNGQWLILRLPARIEAEQRIGGTVWFDDLKISSVRG